jgi:hypothetical protein
MLSRKTPKQTWISYGIVPFEIKIDRSIFHVVLIVVMPAKGITLPVRQKHRPKRVGIMLPEYVTAAVLYLQFNCGLDEATAKKIIHNVHHRTLETAREVVSKTPWQMYTEFNALSNAVTHLDKYAESCYE